jgi:hypothetical protein
MERIHPLGEDFARWVELTDDYEAEIAHASADEMANRGDLAGLARRIREAERAVHSGERAAVLPH